MRWNRRHPRSSTSTQATISRGVRGGSMSARSASQRSVNGRVAVDASLESPSAGNPAPPHRSFRRRMSCAGFRRKRRCREPRCDDARSLPVLGAKRLGHEQDIRERSAPHRHLPGSLEQMPADIPPMSLASPSGCPDRQFGLVPEILKQATQRHPPAIGGYARGALPCRHGCCPAPCLRRLKSNLRSAMPLCGSSCIALPFKRPAAQFVRRFRRIAGRIMPAAAQRHALDQMKVADAGDVHLAARLAGTGIADARCGHRRSPAPPAGQALPPRKPHCQF